MQQEVDQFCSFLKRKGFKLTPQRLRIAEAVFSTHRHFTAEELFVMVRKIEPLVGKVTVYRTLEHLVESGMVEELSLKKGVATYEHVAGHVHHDHLICDSCGRIVELCSPRLERVKREEAEAHHFQVRSHALKMWGLCSACQAKPRRKPPCPSSVLASILILSRALSSVG